MLPGCGSKPAGQPNRLQPLDAAIAAPCPHPAQYLTDAPAEVIAGRIGDALILCGKKQRAAGDYAAAPAETNNPER